MSSKRLLSLFITVLLVASSSMASFASVIYEEPQVIYSTPGETIYNQDGGFVITHAMLSMPFNRITFPGTHNSFADGTFIYGSEQNQDLSITDQLENGIRVLDFDVDTSLYLRHGTTRVRLNERLEEVKNYAQAHPNQIITVRINDYQSSSGDMYERINGRLENTGLDDYIYNWDSTVSNDNSARCTIPNPWPTLGTIINSRKNVIFIHNSNEDGFDVVDSSASKGLSSSNFRNTSYTSHHYEATQLESFSRIQNIWDPANNNRQSVGSNRLFHIEVAPESSPAGDRNAATKNNDGRKLYQIAKQYETELLPDGRVPYVISIDYFKNNYVNNLPVNVVDACNRLNAERAGVDFATASYTWNLYPYEFDFTKKDIISHHSQIRAEVASVYNDFRNGRDLDGHEDKGDIVSTTYQRLEDFDRMPEYAVDNDLNTRWTGSSSRSGHTWGIDLGKQYDLTDIAIAWEFSHKIPAYTIYGSNDDRRFRDDMNNNDLRNDDGWEVISVKSKERSDLSEPLLWEITPMRVRYRYIRIEVTDADSTYWPSISEIKMYTTSPIRSTNLAGGNGGTRVWAPTSNYSKNLRSIILTGTTRVTGIFTNYGDSSSGHDIYRMGIYHNSINYPQQMLTLQTGEYIRYADVGVKWTPERNNNTIHYLKLTTNYGRTIKVGRKPSATIRFSAPSGYHINGFWGSTGDELRQLAAMIKRR